MDEARVGQQGTLTRVWAPRGTRPRALRDHRRNSAYLFGAVCPERGIGAGIDPVRILLAKSSGGGWHGHKPDEGGSACSRAWCACEPGAKAAEVHGGSREHVLQVV